MTYRLGKLVALALVLCAVGAGEASAKPLVEPGYRTASVSVPGTHGWHVDLVTNLGTKARRVTLDTWGPDQQSVSYAVRGRSRPDGTIDATFPGLGRISLRFEQTSQKSEKITTSKWCTGGRTDVTRRGYFRGLIAFRGVGGYTEVRRQSARGQIASSSREVCDFPEAKSTKAAQQSGTQLSWLIAGRPQGDGTLSFRAVSSGRTGWGDSVDFAAEYAYVRRGVRIDAAAGGNGEAESVSFPSALAPPAEATVEPGAPFSGNATFRLEAPKKATWAGDLSVELPILGTVGLAGPKFWSGFCLETCTKTLPPGRHFAFVVGFIS